MGMGWSTSGRVLARKMPNRPRQVSMGPQFEPREGRREDGATGSRGGASVKVSQVLLVEDNPIMCRFISSALDARDIHVTEAHTGAQALGLWAASGSDLILQDTVLPDMDGFELV